jgi:hypothetical protein
VNEVWTPHDAVIFQDWADIGNEGQPHSAEIARKKASQESTDTSSSLRYSTVYMRIK